MSSKPSFRQALVLILLALTIDGMQLFGPADATAAGVLRMAGPAVSAQPWVGALQARPDQLDGLKSIGLNTVTLEIGWDAFEPQPGMVNETYAAEQRNRLQQWTTAGFRVILDTGLQYPPAWAFALPGGTRFANQFGVTRAGGTGSDLVNAVFNPAVRAAEQQYYSLLAANFPVSAFAAVRVGGLNMGEMSYPAANGPSNTLWMYDVSAQATSPVPGWKPGTGTAAEAKAGLDYYLNSLNEYASWLLSVTSQNFPNADLQLLLPSWGLRPGQVDAALAAGLNGSTSAEINSLITEGLDWTAQVPLLQKYGARGVAYTTWLDAPSSDSSPQNMSPVNYLHTLAAPRGIALAGENTGVGTPDTLELSLQRVSQFGLRGMMWMTAADLLRSTPMMQSVAGTTNCIFLIAAVSR